MYSPSVQSLAEGEFLLKEWGQRLESATQTIVDWSQYPLIAILLGVIFFAQKTYREDRARQDERLDKLFSSYDTTLRGVTEALQELVVAIKAIELTNGIRKERRPNG